MRPRAVARTLAFALTIFAATSVIAQAADTSARQTLSFNPNWKFIKQDLEGAANPAFNDSGWQTVSAPHTYNDVDTFDDYSLSGHRGEQNQWSGLTWYRKTFTAPAEWQGKKVFIEFEAVRQVADVYLNGTKLGTCKTGFTPFGFDLTPHLKFGQPNVLAVRVDNRFEKDPYETDGASKPSKAKSKTSKDRANVAPPAGGALQNLQKKFNEDIPENIEDLQADQIPWNNPHWHPAHGGIYRDVTLTVTDPLHIELPLYSFLQTAGPYIYATDVSDQSATVHIEVPVQNERKEAADVEVGAEILDRDGKSVATLTTAAHVDSGGTSTPNLTIKLPHPQLWEPEYPYLYKAVVTLRSNGEAVDSAELPLGIRTVEWTADHGFFINGHHEKLHGWGQKPTDEWPALGAAQPDWLHYFTLNLMKEAGGNWVRWGHCATGAGQIAACDQLGMMVEQPGVDGESDTVRAAWKLRVDAFRDVLIYFRNNPSIMIWEGGNQKVTLEHAKELRGLMDKYDPHGGRVYAHRRSDKATAGVADIIIGSEGGREFADKPVVEGEYDREESPRRVWDDKTPRPLSATQPSDIVYGYPEAKGMTYDLTSEQYAVNQVQQWVKKCGAENHCGGANWIFSDTTSGGRVPAEVSRAGGEVDGERLPKEAYYVCQVMWDPTPRTHIIGHWNYAQGMTKDVYVVANDRADDVELFINNKSVGHAKPEDQFLFTFKDVKFEPGEIKAVAYANGREVSEQTKKTTGPPASLKLTPIIGPKGFRATGSDVLLVDAEVLDAQGNRVPTYYGPITFSPSGPAVWRGGYNSGVPHSINKTTLGLEDGINRVALRSTLQPGEIKVEAQVPNLPPATIEVASQPVEIENGGMSPVLPPLPQPPHLTKPAPQVAAANAQSATGTPQPNSSLIGGFNYTGPTAGASVKPFTADTSLYCDRHTRIKKIPADLQKEGTEILQLPSKDNGYSALDLIQFTATKDLDLYVAYDERLPTPKWLATDFQKTGEQFAVGKAHLTLYKRHVPKDASVTLGGNTDAQNPPANTMYTAFLVPQ
jgi:beta-galactosidase